MHGRRIRKEEDKNAEAEKNRGGGVEIEVKENRIQDVDEERGRR